MASLKEIKQRIGSVEGTKKVTSAMKMVSSAKLHKSQTSLSGLLPYRMALDSILYNFLDGELKIDSPFVLEKSNSEAQSGTTASNSANNKINDAFSLHLSENKKIAVVLFSSNSSLCGSFNYNVTKEFIALISSLKQECKKRNITTPVEELVDVYPIGKKIEEAVVRMGFKLTHVDGYKYSDYQHLASKPSITEITMIANELMNRFKWGELCDIIMIYHHFRSAGVQVLTKETLLPVQLDELKRSIEASRSKSELDEWIDRKGSYLHNYIVEPSVNEVIASLLPQVIIQKLYTCLIDSITSEHAARTVAMQVATDNAEDLINELTILYNKSRQGAITAELLDIVAGSSQ